MRNRSGSEIALYRRIHANGNDAMFIDTQPENLEQALYHTITRDDNDSALAILNDHLDALDINAPIVTSRHSLLEPPTFLLHKAVCLGNVEVVRLMTQHPRINLNIRATQTLETPLHFAAELPDQTILLLLLTLGASVNALNLNDETPIMFAVNDGLVRNVEVLCKADVNLGFVYRDNETILSYAIKKAFTEKTNLDAADDPDSIIRLKALYENAKEVVRTLLLNGAGMGSDFPTLFYSLEIDMSSCWCFGATVDGQPLNRDHRGFNDAVMTWDDLTRQYSPDNLPNPQLVLRFEELRRRLTDADYAPFESIKRELQSSKLLPINEDWYIDVAAENNLYQQRITELSRLASLLPDNIFTGVVESLLFKLLVACIAFGSIGSGLFGSFLSRVFLTLMYTTPPTEINCWKVLPVLFTNNTYTKTNSYPGCGGLFTFFLGSALLLFLGTSTILISCIVVGRRSRNTYLQLQEFQHRITVEDEEGKQLRLRQIPVDNIVHCSIINSQQPIEALLSEYKLGLRELRELHPRYTNQPRFYQPAPALPGYQGRNPLTDTTIDFSVNGGQDDDISLMEQGKHQI